VSLISDEIPSEYLDSVSEFRLSGISITDVSFVKKEKNISQITIEGSANSRADLIALWKKAKSVSWIPTSEMPISDLTSDKDLGFLIIFNATSSQL
jgi:hypothetical protein